MKTAILIPARFQSSRFKGKPLAKILNKSMIEWVYKGVCEAQYADFTAVLTDDMRIFNEVKNFGGNVFMVKGNFQSGTDRIAHFVKDKDYDYIVNMQGDEPLMDSKTIDRLINFALMQKCEMATLSSECKEDEIDDPNIVKIVTDTDNNALYFSRSKIPFNRGKCNKFIKHIGIYIYSKETLMKLYTLKPSILEKCEKLEQLRALENGIKIKVCTTNRVLIGVDTKDDLVKVENYLKNP